MWLPHPNQFCPRLSCIHLQMYGSLSVIGKSLLCGVIAAACLINLSRTTVGQAKAANSNKPQGNPPSSCGNPGQDKIDAYKKAAEQTKEALSKLKTANTGAQGDADKINTALGKITVDEAMTQQLSTVIDILETGVDKGGRFQPLQNGAEELNKKLNELENAYAPFKPCEKAPEPAGSIKEILDDYKALQTSTKAELTADKKAKALEPLTKAINSIENKVKDFLAGENTKGAGVAALRGELTPQTLRGDLPEKLPDLALALRVRRLFEAISKRLSDALDPTKHQDLKNVINSRPDFKPSVDKIDANLQDALKKVSGWAIQSVETAREEQIAANKDLLEAMRDPYHQVNQALSRAKNADKVQKDLTRLATGFKETLSELQKESLPASLKLGGQPILNERELSDNIGLLELLTERLSRTVSQLNSDIQVDKSTWTMASVDLFYFDNVERLIRVLSPNARFVGGDKTLQEQAKAARDTLLRASQDLENKEQAVSDARRQVDKLTEQLRQAQIKANNAIGEQQGEIKAAKDAAAAAQSKARRLTAQREIADLRKTRAQAAFDEADAAAKARPDDADAKMLRATAKQQLEDAEFAALKAKSAETIANQEAADTDAALNAATTAHSQEVTDLKERLTESETTLESAISKRTTATNDQREAQKAAFLAVQAENFAFAAARDNTPFLTNLPEPGSDTSSNDSDPISHVLLFAFPDSKTIFIRGQQDDIDVARQIVKEFDQPEGQAMMTLRVVEISSDGSRKSAKRALEFLKIMDDEVSGAQAQVDAALANLRNVINNQVDLASSKYKAPLVKKIKELEAKNKELEGKPNAKTEIDQNNIKIDTIIARIKEPLLESVAFYDEHVLEALGWDDKLIDKLADFRFLNAVIPRPSHTVTLAQALIVLSLAKTEYRSAIYKDLFPPLPDKKDGNPPFSCEERQDISDKKKKAQPDPFISLRCFIGSNGKSADILGFQARLIEALRFNGITHVIESAESLVRADLPLQREEIELNSKIAPPPSGATQEEIDRNLERRSNLKAVRKNIDNSLYYLLGWLQKNTPSADPARLRARIEATIKEDRGTSSLLLEAVGLRRSARYRFSQASESAVNLTFRKYLEQVNRDLSDVYVKPAFRRLNERVLDKRLGTGVIQETSILASNRLGARVDPRGSAQLAVGEEVNLLESARQLTGILGSVGQGFATGVFGNPASLAGGHGAAASSTLTGAQSALNSLDQLPRDTRSAIYGIATGNLFQVNPIIDPSGQSLRFRFDFVSATQIREPDDTVDPQLPRIERHSVNTEVQLANQEVRLISQFQANSRLGINTWKSGGIPILKYVPWVNEVPLIGWFVRRGGRSSETQHSLIFCQTALYPTLGEVLDLAVQAPSFALGN
jgi:hypothetical protein